MACATDAGRHERMLDITGGDVAALNEVTITLDLLAAQDDPDLTAAVSLARHRDYLADRNTNIPTRCPPCGPLSASTSAPKPSPALSPTCTSGRRR
jgi:hypothetical protein